MSYQYLGNGVANVIVNGVVICQVKQPVRKY